MADASKQEGSAKKSKGSGNGQIKKDNHPVKKTTATSVPQRLENSKTFFRGVINELKKVHWPTRQETMVYTAVVLAAVVFVAMLIWVFDLILGSVMGLVIK